MKKLIVFALVVLAGLGSASLASAQERQLRGQIPFGFIAGSARLPAGDYRLTYDMSGLLTLHNVTVTAKWPWRKPIGASRMERAR
jgi:hypothetical protein